MSEELTLAEAMHVWCECGGETFGPHVEHVSMKRDDFLRFCQALLARRTPTNSGESAAVEGATTKRSDPLSDPNVIHVNMLRGTIAKPSISQIIHIYGAEKLRAALRESAADPVCAKNAHTAAEPEQNDGDG